MSKKAIFAQTFLAYWIDVAAKLRDEHGWDICYFVGKESLKEKALKLFPEAVFHTKAAFLKNLVPDECKAVVPSPLDKELLLALSSYESIFIKMMDRYNFDGSLTCQKRLSNYHFMLRYWKGALEHFKPDVIVYPVAPHLGYDYVLYALSRVMNIPTVMFERTLLPGFVYPVSSFEDGSEIIRRSYLKALQSDEKSQTPLTPETTAYLETLSKDYKSAMPFHLKYKLTHFKKEGDVGNTAPLLLRIATDFIIAHVIKRGNLRFLRKNYYKNIGLLKKKKLLAHYRHLANAVNLEVPYVFAALQCEPERQTCPVGGVFGNQYLMIDLLSKVVPQGWKIYVKEHPSQFKGYQMAERARTFEFYNMIASMPKVELVPLTYTSFDLIDRAQATATVSGTVGWESAVRGKPTLLFGHSWYEDCKGIFVTHTVEGCKKAIQKIENGYRANMDEIKCFARVVESCSVRGYIDRLYEKMNIISSEENAENLTRAILEFIS
jgi:hypothetical protein